MRTIFKQRLDVCDQQTIELPQDFRILHLGIQRGESCIWYECDTDKPLRRLDIYCFGTGYRMDDLPPMEHIGTVLIDGFVWHYYRCAEGFID